MIERRLRIALASMLGCLCLVGAARADDGAMRMGMFVLWARTPDGADGGGREANLRDWEKNSTCPRRRCSRSISTETRLGRRCTLGNGFPLIGRGAIRTEN